MATARTFSPASTNPFLRTLTSPYAWTPGDTVTVFFKPTDLDRDGADDLRQTGVDAALRSVFKAWSAVANLSFAEASSQRRADWTEAMVASGDFGAQHYFPMNARGEGFGGEYNMLSSTKASNAVGGSDYSTYVHEVGHGIGLNHTHADGEGARAFPGVSSSSDLGDHKLNQDIFSVMSYNFGWDAVEAQQSRAEGYGWVGGPMAFDIAAAQAIYGANMKTNAGDTTYTLPHANKAGTFFSCIWDAGGVDTISAGNTTRGVTIDLNDATLRNETGGGGFVSRAADILGGFTIANGVTIENATGGRGNDRLLGNEAANVLAGGSGADTMIGGRGDDTYMVGDRKDVVVEKPGQGTDTVHASLSYTLGANVENLKLIGKALNGTGNGLANGLQGNNGANTLRGGNGDDRLNGAGGSDTLSGGKGADKFIFSSTLGRSNVDTIADFGNGADVILLENAIFTGLKRKGALAASLFKDLSEAHADSGDRILYDHEAGNLFYDADGSGKVAAIRFAHLENRAALSADDFIVV